MEQTFSFSNITYMWCKHFCIIILYFRDVQAEFLPDYCNKSDDFWDSLWSFQLSQLSESVSVWSLQILHDRPNCSDNENNLIQCPSDWGHLSCPCCLWSSGYCSHMIILITWTLFDTTEWGDEDDPDDHVKTRLKSQQENPLFPDCCMGLYLSPASFCSSMHFWLQVKTLK